ncbi:unnamed protein product [Owenia fusiformis]|uniref:Sulfotransferase domain-containing protein n=1 Tax=Owenia fusiformis TaxID=6347 RepID=A0A8S4NCI0_OWEFU|nr:unnamed protein product [Owenia fusiformis]
MISQSKIRVICLCIVSIITTIALMSFQWTGHAKEVNRPVPVKRVYIVKNKGLSSYIEPRSKVNLHLKGFRKNDRNENLLMYSKASKCGSTTLLAVMTTACEYSGKYNLTHILPVPEISELTTVAEKQNYALTQLQDKRPTIVVGHFSFFDFIELGFKQPLFIDIVRDPVERWISNFYYYRSSEIHIKRLNFTEGETNQTFEECYQMWKKKTGCSGKNIKQTVACLKEKPAKGCLRFKVYHSYYSFWFSGKYSTNRSLISSANAKSNIEKYYAFVGLTEHFNETVRAMERVLPRFTDELSRAYNAHRVVQVKNRSLRKARPSNKTIAVMKEYLADDYDFYKFISQRFYRHLKHLGIKLT